MQLFYKLSLLIMLTLPVAASAQQGALIKGKVTDKTTGEALPGASIRVAGTSRGTVSNVYGEYSFQVSAGELSLNASYIGYIAIDLPVAITSGQTVTANIELEQDIVKMEGVVVTGQLQGQAKALNQQRNATSIRNVVAADQIGRFPDPNVAEALQRVNGVNVARDEGEGRYVLVRGLAPQFTNVSINGEQIPSPESDVRYMALDAVPADQLASMEIVKALTPDMDGDAIGGSVNLITRAAESSKMSVSGTLGGEYNDLMGRAGSQTSLSISQRLGKEERFGFLVNASFYGSNRGSDKVEPTDWDDNDLERLEFRDYEIKRNRVGLSSSLDYRLSDATTVYGKFIYSALNEHENRRRIRFDTDAITRDLKSRPENQGVYSANLGGKTATPTFTVDYEVSYARAFQDTPRDRNVFFEQEDLTVTFNTSNPLRPTFTIEDEEGAAVDYLDNSRYEFKEFENSKTLALDDNVTAKFNVAIPISGSSFTGIAKAGAKARFKTKSFRVKSYQLLEYDGDEDLTFDRFAGNFNSSPFLDGDYTFGNSPSENDFLAFLNANSGDFEEDGDAAVEETTIGNYDATENVYAGYAMADLNFGALSLTGGVRYEFTDVSYESFVFDEDAVAAIPVSGGTNYGFILPSLHARYAIAPLTNIRAAMGWSYARPNFSDIFGERVFVPSDGEAELGNASLKPVSAFNMDLMAEHYFGTVGVVSGGVFAKRLNNFIYTKAVRETYRGVDDVLIAQAQNGEEATLYGAEIAWQQNLTFLPGALSGLGLYANYTYTFSEAKIANRFDADEESETIRLPGQSEHIGNMALSYNWKGFQARVMANFNGAFIEELGSSASEDYYVDKRTQIDFSASQAINKKARVFVELINLTNERRIDYLGTLDRPLTREIYGFWGRMGVKVDL